MELIWSCALERGNDMVRTVLAIGQEAGLRIGEICNLRISDVDLVSQTLHVRLPNKSDTERTAFFSCLTAHHLPIWLEARGACEHDHLFHNSIGRPFQVGTLHAILAKVPRASYYLPAQAIAWQRAYPDDPRAPELLGEAFRVVRNACTDKTSSATEHQLFLILRRQYPGNHWTARYRSWE